MTGLALSCDGVHFSRMHQFATSVWAREGRTADHPVVGFFEDGADVHFYIQLDVPGVG